MDKPEGEPEIVLAQCLGRSEALQNAIAERLADSAFHPSDRGQTSLRMCSVSMDHWVSLRILISEGHPTSAIGLMRLQFEALARAMWIMYAASDAAVAKLSAPLNTTSEQAAKNLPAIGSMIDAIGERVGSSAPAAAHQMLRHFADQQLKSLNSFVHGGIHPLRRDADGYPISLLLQVLKSANALATMAGMNLALLTGDADTAKVMGRIQRDFEDCLPPLLPLEAEGRRAP